MKSAAQILPNQVLQGLFYKGNSLVFQESRMDALRVLEMGLLRVRLTKHKKD